MIAVTALLALALPGAAFAATPNDGEPPPPTIAPTPDPAPPVSKPKPVGPAPKPAHVYQAPAPVIHATPAPQPVYTPPPVVHRTVKKAVHHRRKPKATLVPAAPKPAPQVKRPRIVHITAVPAAAAVTTATASDALRRSAVIAGFGLAALLFLIVVALPSTGARFTPPGRLLMDHQTHVVIIGAALLLLTALVFAVAGQGS